MSTRSQNSWQIKISFRNGWEKAPSIFGQARLTQLYFVTQLDDLSPLYWVLCIDHLHISNIQWTQKYSVTMHDDTGWGSLQTALLLWPKRLPQDCHPKVNRHHNISRYLTIMLLQHPLRHAPVGDDEREHPQDCRGKSKSGQEKCRILSSVGQKNCKSTLIVV